MNEKEVLDFWEFSPTGNPAGDVAWLVGLERMEGESDEQLICRARAARSRCTASLYHILEEWDNRHDK